MKEKFSIKKKKTVLKRFEIFNKEFVQHAEKAGEQRNMAKMKVYLTKGSVLKRNSEEQGNC